MRPFEHGDLIIGSTIYRPEIYREFTVSQWAHGFSFCEDGFYFNHNEVVIKTIRKPRQGSKEARDIVAMLLYRFRKFVQFYIFVSAGLKRPKDNVPIKHYYQKWKKEHYLYQCYEKAKSMLK